MLDISHNQLEDLHSDKEAFRLPPNITEIYLSHNRLRDLNWDHFKNVSRISVLDLSYNNFERFGQALIGMVIRNASVYFSGK